MNSANNEYKTGNYNSIDKVPDNLPINNSILINEDKTLNLVKLVIAERKKTSKAAESIPDSFDEISATIFSKIKIIDSIHQKNIISRDKAIEMIADLLENDGMQTQVQVKYFNYLDDLNSGNINYEEFQEKCSKLRDSHDNSLENNLFDDEVLYTHSR